MHQIGSTAFQNEQAHVTKPSASNDMTEVKGYVSHKQPTKIAELLLRHLILWTVLNYSSHLWQSEAFWQTTENNNDKLPPILTSHRLATPAQSCTTSEWRLLLLEPKNASWLLLMNLIATLVVYDILSIGFKSTDFKLATRRETVCRIMESDATTTMLNKSSVIAESGARWQSIY